MTREFAQPLLLDPDVLEPDEPGTPDHDEDETVVPPEDDDA